MSTLLLCILALFSFSCTKNEKQLQRQGDTSGDVTRQTLQESVIFAYDSTTKLWELRSQSIHQLTDDKKIVAIPVVLDIFNDSGVITTTVTADSGSTPQAMNSFFVWGNVRIRNRDSSKVITNSLGWNKSRRKLFSDDYVEILSADGEQMRGKGFEAGEDLSWWEFHQEVRGNFPSFDKRLQGNDSVQTEDSQ